MDQTKTILYIEDSGANRQLVEMLLEERNDIALALAENGRKGIQAAQSKEFDLILLDLTLPDMTGQEVFTTLRLHTTTKTTPIIIVSGDMPKDFESNSTFNYHHFITKPFDIKTFFTTIDSVLYE